MVIRPVVSASALIIIKTKVLHPQTLVILGEFGNSFMPFGFLAHKGL
jgi:hypothetical protein